MHGEGSLASEKVPISALASSRKVSEQMKKRFFSSEKVLTLEGMMTFGKLENGLSTVDFQCCEDVELEAYIGTCKMQLMRDGNIYITELPKRIRNKALFRDDNSSLSKGQNGKWYFYFSLDGDRINELPAELVRQASAIAQKVVQELIKGGIAL